MGSDEEGSVFYSIRSRSWTGARHELSIKRVNLLTLWGMDNKDSNLKKKKANKLRLRAVV